MGLPPASEKLRRLEERWWCCDFGVCWCVRVGGGGGWRRGDSEGTFTRSLCRQHGACIEFGAPRRLRLPTPRPDGGGHGPAPAYKASKTTSQATCTDTVIGVRTACCGEHACRENPARPKCFATNFTPSTGPCHFRCCNQLQGHSGPASYGM